MSEVACWTNGGKSPIEGVWNINRRTGTGELGTWCLMQSRGCADNGKVVDGTEWVREKMRQSGADERELALIQGQYLANRPVDGDLDIILFKRQGIGYAGGIVRFTAHAVICSGGYWHPNLGRDYPGRMCDLLSDAFGCPILFAQGPAADHRTRHHSCGLTERNRIAEGLAGEILKRRTNMRRFACDKIEYSQTVVDCPLRPDLPLSQSEAKAELVKVLERKAHLRSGTLNDLRLRKELSELEKHYDQLANMDFFWNYVQPIEHARKQAALPVSLWGIPGGFRVLQFPGELAAAALSDFPRAIDGNIPLVITSYTDGVAGYILPDCFFKEGGYETISALFAPETVTCLTKAAISLLSCAKMKLAIHGGKPVRTEPLAPQFIGANLIGMEEKILVDKVIDSKSLFRHYGSDCQNMVSTFEEEFRTLLGTRYALATATGSGALFCIMKALNISKGDEVIIPAFGWITDYNAVELFGATPVFAAIDDSMNISPEDFEARITKKTKAVIVIYYQGAASRIDEIIKIARKHKVKVIEDVAQSAGGTYNGKMLGSLGDVSFFSLQNNKVITSGDGGILATNDQETYERAVRFHDLGLLRPSFINNLEKAVITKDFPGFQWRMNELTGAVALAQLRKLPGIVRTTRSNSAKLRSILVKEFPEMKFRDVKPENDIGIVLSIDLGSAGNVEKFKEAYVAEGLKFGPTSGCKTLDELEPVLASLKGKKSYDKKVFEKSRQIERKMAGIAVLPVYGEKDINDIAMGIIKVVKGLNLL